jgi:integrase
MAANKLTDLKVKKAAPKQKPYKITDGHGLHLYVTPAGKKFWRWNVYRGNHETVVAIGEYPAMPLSEARAEHERRVKLVRSGGSPSARKLIHVSLKGGPTTFADVKDKWMAVWKEGLDADYVEQVNSRLDADVLPKLGSRPIADIEVPEIAAVVSTIDARGANELARKALRTISQIFRFGITHGYARRNPAADIKPGDFLRKVIVQNHPRVPDSKIPKLLYDIEHYSGREVTKSAMRIMARTFLRTSELVQAPWTEIDLDNARWTIPAERMKMPSSHIIPLSRQVVAEMRKLQSLTQNEQWLLPSDWYQDECMSTGAISGALKRMGYRGIMTGHGFRGVASTVLHELGYEDAHIEVQLAHLKRSKNKTSAAYDYAKYLEPRTKMMQAWSDYLDNQLSSASS